MAICKQNSGSLASSGECRKPTNKALVYSTQLDEGYILTTQIPLCKEHLDIRQDAFKKASYPYMVKDL